MLIRKIELKNFRGIKHEELKPKLNEAFILWGKNGSGKSTFIYAPAFCFYGYAPWKLENTLRWGAKSGYVKVDFERQGKKYRAVRKLDKRSTEFSIKQYIESKGEFKDIGGGLNREAEEAFKKIFPVPKEAFLQVVTKTQGNLGDFCKATPKGMYDIIKNFVEVVKFEKYKKRNDELIDDLEREKIELESTMSSSQNAIDNLDLKDVSDEELNEMKEKIKNYKEKIDSLKDKLEESKKWHEQKDEFIWAKKVMEKLDGVKEWYEKWQPLKTAQEPDEPYDKNELTNLKDKLNDLKEEKEDIPKQITTLEGNIEGYQDKLEEKHSKEDDMLTENREIKAEIKEVKREKELLENGKCPKCERRFRKTDSRIKEKEEKLEKLNSKLIPNKKLNQIQDEINELESKIRDTQAETKKLNKKLMKVTSKMGKVENKITKMKSAKEATEKWQQKQNFFDEYPFDMNPDKVYRKYQNAKEVEKPEGDKPKEPKQIKNDLDTCESEYMDLKSSYENMENKKEQYEYHKEQIEEAKEELQDTREELKRHKQLNKIYSRRGAPHFMVKEFLQHLQHNANKYLDRFTNGRISIEFKTNHESKSKPIELIFYDARRNNAPRPFSTFSGGEKTRVALSIEFLGMGKTFGQLTNIDLKTGLIDEVYGLDEEGQEEFARILNEMSGTRPVIGGVVCFEEMAHNFENVIKVEEGELIYD